MVAMEPDPGEHREIVVELQVSERDLSRHVQRRMARDRAVAMMAEEGYVPMGYSRPAPRRLRDGVWSVVGWWSRPPQRERG